MVPAPIDPAIKDVAEPRKDSVPLPEAARERLTKAGIDLSKGYPYRPSRPLYLQDVYKIRNEEREYIDAGSRADKSKKNLFSAATKVTDLTSHIGTEIEGVQLKDLTPAQRDELALLIAERSVVFLRNQDLSPQQQKELGEWYGEVEVHVSQYHTVFVNLTTSADSRPGHSPKYRKCRGLLASRVYGLTYKQPSFLPTSENREVLRDGIAIWYMSVSQLGSRIFTTTRFLPLVEIHSGQADMVPTRSSRRSLGRSSMVGLPSIVLRTHI